MKTGIPNIQKVEALIMLADASILRPDLEWKFDKHANQILHGPKSTPQPTKRKTSSISEDKDCSTVFSGDCGDLFGSSDSKSSEESTPNPKRNKKSPENVLTVQGNQKKRNKQQKERNQEKWGMRWHTCDGINFEHGKIFAICGDDDENVIYCEQRPNKYVRLSKSKCSKNHYYLLQEVDMQFNESDIIDNDVVFEYLRIKLHKDQSVKHTYPQFCIPEELTAKHLQLFKEKKQNANLPIRPLRRRATIQDEEIVHSSPKLRVKPKSKPMEKEIPLLEHGEVVLVVEDHKPIYYTRKYGEDFKLVQNSDGNFYPSEKASDDVSKKDIQIRNVKAFCKLVKLDGRDMQQYHIPRRIRDEHLLYVKDKLIA